MTIARREIRYGGAMLDQKEIDAVVNVMQTSMVVGPQVQSFEKRCAQLLGHEYGIMVNSGSSALMLALRQSERVTRQAHRASATWETRTAMGEMVLAGIAQALAGERPSMSLTT